MMQHLRVGQNIILNGKTYGPMHESLENSELLESSVRWTSQIDFIQHSILLELHKTDWTCRTRRLDDCDVRAVSLNEPWNEK